MKIMTTKEVEVIADIQCDVCHKSTIPHMNRHSAPDLGINLPIALTQYLQNDLLVSC